MSSKQKTSLQSGEVRVRIAPSPTGLFHIGTARTALFNYLFAKHNQGKFIIRVEDTDTKRSKPEYEADILTGLKWLGLEHDEQIYHQRERLEIYQKYADQLLEQGLAYQKDGAVWFKLASYPKEKIKFHDLIMGDMEFRRDNFNDFVIIKSDGIPLYMFAAVVDDHDMGMTHIIRGDDHVNSTPQQIMLYESLNFSVPEFAHMPLILNKDRSKMSKRKNPVSVTKDFRDQGYLPEAMINYMALLGWNPKTEQEIFSLSELVTNFSLEKVNRSGAIFDIEKLDWFNRYYKLHPEKLYLSDPEIVFKEYVDIIKENKLGKIDTKFVGKIQQITLNRVSSKEDILPLIKFFYQLPDYKSDLLVFKKSTPTDSLLALETSVASLEKTKAKDWETVKTLNQILLDVMNNNSLKPGDIFWPVRVALSGLGKSPSPPELLWVLGQQESVHRIKQAIKKLK